MGLDGSSLFLVLILGMFVFRMLAGQRRRSSGFGSRARGGAPTYFAPPPNSPGGATSDASTGTRPGYTGIPAGWMRDPSGKHDQRYWSGSEWTEHVTTGGVPGIDPPPGRAPRADGGPSTPPGSGPPPPAGGDG